MIALMKESNSLLIMDNGVIFKPLSHNAFITQRVTEQEPHRFVSVGLLYVQNVFEDLLCQWHLLVFSRRTIGTAQTVRGLGLAEEGFGALSPSACSTPTGQPHRWNRWMTCKKFAQMAKLCQGNMWAKMARNGTIKTSRC